VASWRFWLAVGLVAWIPRAIQAVVEPAYLHPDALFQGLEPAFRLLYGHGEVAWEFRQGLRSFVWPGVLAAPMKLADVLGVGGPGVDMAPSLTLARWLVACIDAACVVLAARLAGHVLGGGLGRWAAIATASLLAIHPAFVVMGAQPLVDVPAACALLWACERAFACDAIDRRRALWLGVALGLTVALRVQLAPAVLAIAAIVWWRARRGEVAAADRGRWLAAAIGAAVPVLSFGALDWLTWGAPFHSTVAYLVYSFEEGTRAFGQMPADRYVEHFRLALPWLALLLTVFAVIGARRSPALAIVFLAVVVPHQLVPYRVWRFVYAASVILVPLAAVGLVLMLSRVAHARARLALAGSAVAALLSATVLAWTGPSIWQTTWLYNQGGPEAVERSRGLNRAYLELSRQPRVPRVAQSVLPQNAAPGHALLGHDVEVVHLLGGRRPLPSSGAMLWITFLPQGHDASFAASQGVQVVWRDPEGPVVILGLRAS